MPISAWRCRAPAPGSALGPSPISSWPSPCAPGSPSTARRSSGSIPSVRGEPTARTRGESPAPVTLLDRYDALLLDLDGVVYRGDEPVPGAADTLAEARRRGVRL